MIDTLTNDGFLYMKLSLFETTEPKITTTKCTDINTLALAWKPSVFDFL